MNASLPPRAILWDFGGVFTTSPFEAFLAYERQKGLPEGLIRTVNTRNPDTNAWARLERNEITVRQFRTACITNNFGTIGPEAVSPARAAAWKEVSALFEFVLESSKVGARKPEPAIYLMACEKLGVAPTEAVFLDDLGINLKPARALGMRTVKVENPDQALAELEVITGLALR